MNCACRSLRFLTVSIIILGLTQSGITRDLESSLRIGPGDGRDIFTGPNGDGQNPPAPTDFPLTWGLHQTSALNASFTAFGTLGMGMSDHSAVPGWPQASFESPAGSGVEYHWAGAIWVGGIVGNDTLVSVGMDGWQNVRELNPPEYGGGVMRGSVVEIPSHANQAFRTEFSDTVQVGLMPPNDWTGRPYKALPVNLVLKSYSFRGDLENRIIVYDLIITNIGTQQIEKGYVGFYHDADVGISGNQNRAQDDLAGSIPSLGLAYILDNNGDPGQSGYTNESCPGIFAFKLLATSFALADVSFNWWISNSTGSLDFGPRLRSNYRDFGTGGRGTPEGDRNKYFVMQNRELDYDQVLTATITPNDPVWELPPAAEAVTYSRGVDTRFLLSTGPFDLAPDSSARVLLTTFTADSVLTDPNCATYLTTTYQPYNWLQTLNFSGVEAVSRVADSIVTYILSPANAVTGVKAIHRYRDSVEVEWDPFVFNMDTMYDIYLTEVPESAFPFPGLVPPWYRPGSPVQIDEVGRQRRYTFHNLDPLKSYICNIAHRYVGGVGTLSEPTVIKAATELPPPEVKDTFCFIRSVGTPTIAWSADSGAVHHYNIYRFADSATAFTRYVPHYSRTLESIPPHQSMVHDGVLYYYYALQPTAQVPYTDTLFADPDAVGDNWYAVTAVDSGGYESGFSQLIRVIDARRSSDILVMSNANPSLGYVFYDTVKSFYNDVLNGYNYDFFSWVDSTQGVHCESMAPTCVDWHDFMRYRLLIVDDGLKDQIMISRYEDATSGFAKYLLSGGKIIYCGSFANLRQSPLQPTELPKMYGPGASFVTRFFGIDSTFFVGYYYYALHTSPPLVDSLFAFSYAEAVDAGIPNIPYDLSRNAFKSTFANYWPVGTPPTVSTFQVNTRATPLHTFRSLNPAGSMNEGQVVSLMTAGPEAETYLFGFHLWYMERAATRALIDWIMLRVPTSSETVTTKVPHQLLLAQNYPNPFNPSTTIAYELPRAGQVRLEIFNILGQRIRRLVDEVRPAGPHRTVWDGHNDRGHAVSSGVYLYRLVSSEGRLVKKMILLK